MNDLDDLDVMTSEKAIGKIKLISGIMRTLVWLTFFLAVVVFCAAFIFGVDVEVTILDKTQLPSTAMAQIHWLLLPLFVAILLGLICLERFFSLLQKDQFFDQSCRNYLLWLAWLNMFATVYNMSYPLLINLFFADDTESLDINIAPLRLLGAGLLLVIAWLMTLAAEIDRENKEFV